MKFRALLLSLTLVGCAHYVRYTEKNIYDQINKSSVVVEVSSGLGSGTIVHAGNKSALILTCAHVIADEPVAVIRYWNKGKERVAVASIEKVDISADLALLSIDGDLRGLEMPIASTPPDLHDAVYLVGAPGCIPHTVSSGVVAGLLIDSMFGEGRWQVDGAVTAPGMSGGTVANQHAELVCVHEAGVQPGGIKLWGVGICIGLPVVRSFVASYHL